MAWKAKLMQGAYAVAWGVMLIWLYSLSVWGWWLTLNGHRTWLLTAMGLWLMAFLALEVTGAYRSAKLRDERARTLSAVMQWVATLTPGTTWYRGWDAVAAGTALLIGADAGWLVWQWNRAAGLVIGLTVAGWNVYHWLRPEKYDAGWLRRYEYDS